MSIVARLASPRMRLEQQNLQCRGSRCVYIYIYTYIYHIYIYIYLYLFIYLFIHLCTHSLSLSLFLRSNRGLGFTGNVRDLPSGTLRLQVLFVIVEYVHNYNTSFSIFIIIMMIVVTIVVIVIVAIVIYYLERAPAERVPRNSYGRCTSDHADRINILHVLCIISLSLSLSLYIYIYI